MKDVAPILPIFRNWAVNKSIPMKLNKIKLPERSFDMQNSSPLAMFESFHLSLKSKELRQSVSGSRVVEVECLIVTITLDYITWDSYQFGLVLLKSRGNIYNCCA